MATNRTFKGGIKPFGKSGHFSEHNRHVLQGKGLKTGTHTTGTNPINYTPKPKLVSPPKEEQPIISWFDNEIVDGEVKFRMEEAGQKGILEETEKLTEWEALGAKIEHLKERLDLHQKELPSDTDTISKLKSEIDKTSADQTKLYKDAESQFKEKAEQRAYEDTDLFQMNWDDNMEYLTEQMSSLNPKGMWKASVNNFGWRSQDGEKAPFRAETGSELLRQILPNTDNSFRIFKTRTGFKIQNYHHDSPTGNEWYHIDRATQKDLKD